MPGDGRSIGWVLARSAMLGLIGLLLLSGSLSCTAVLPEEIVGVYHVPGANDATNLEIFGDGTFVWTADLCDSSQSDSGRVVVENGFELIADNDDELFFPAALPDGYGSPIAEGADVVTARLEEDGSLVTTVNGQSLIWLPGRVCSICDPETGQFSIGLQACD
jgi:hypothetical protein